MYIKKEWYSVYNENIIRIFNFNFEKNEYYTSKSSKDDLYVAFKADIVHLKRLGLGRSKKILKKDL